LVRKAISGLTELGHRPRSAGFDVRGICPPTVRADAARLRLSLTLHVDEAQVAALADTLREALDG